MTATARPLISICVCTYRRPAGLARLMAALRHIAVPAGVEVELLVVDNDDAGSARQTFEACAGDWPWPARYGVEPRSGVGHARSRCAQDARGDWIAFIDDDEWPEPVWLTALWTTQQKLGADGVFGPVLARFDEPPPDWLVQSRLYDRPRFATGATLGWPQCATGNVLFRRQLFFDAGGFDPAFAQSGSEDSDFFWRCLDRGARFVWCDEAIVLEGVPPHRMTVAYLNQRAYVAGLNYARLHANRHGTFAFLTLALRGLAVVVAFAPLTWVSGWLKHPAKLRYEGKLQGGLGKIQAAWAPVSDEYGAGSSTPGDS
ncbi:glycosyltransferase family 2 protein [Roseateles sp.]|uniref:glycosyltransferase family 2 protein n=1 Tax=Roseateles sp. TaxID=1971397 RepID=UPI003BAB17C8